MNGIKFLLDTNFVLGLLKATPEVVEKVSQLDILASSCGYSSVTRMELLGYPNITIDEEQLIADRLSKFTYLPITIEIENLAIALRRTRRVKLPDALVASTAIHHGLELMTLDKALLSLVSQAVPPH
jgi:predicted nucleic acid-binding protein